MSIDTTRSTRQDDETPSVTHDSSDKTAEQTTRAQAGPDDNRSRRPAETLTREEYADVMRGNSPLDENKDRPADPGDEPAGDGPVDPPAVTHFHSEFKGQQHDLYTDGTRWAVVDTPHAPDTIVENREARDQLPTSEPHQADAERRDWPDDQPSSVYVDGREVQATHDPADGIWFEGMGEIPDAPIGDPYGTGRAGEVVASPDEIKMSRLERLNSVVCERLDDIVEEIDHNAETIQELHHKDPLDPSIPTFTGTADRSPQISPSILDHGMEFGHGLDAVLVMGAVGAKIGNWVHEKWQERMRDASHASN